MVHVYYRDDDLEGKQAVTKDEHQVGIGISGGVEFTAVDVVVAVTPGCSRVPTIHLLGTVNSDTTLLLFVTQVLQRLTGSCLRFGAQASVPHADVATVIAPRVVLLWTEISARVGSGLVGAIWAGTMPGRLREYLPDLSQAERDVVFGDIKIQERHGGREDVVAQQAYSKTMKVTLVLAMALGVIPLVLSLFMPDRYLGDQHNAVKEVDLLLRCSQRTSPRARTRRTGGRARTARREGAL